MNLTGHKRIAAGDESMKKYIIFSLFFMAFLSLLPALSVAGQPGLRGNIVNPDSLPDDLKSIKIENYFPDSGSWPVGTVQNLTGDVVVLRKDTGKAYFAATGDIVYQNDIFFTLRDSRCRIRFSTEDVVTMGENGKISIDEVNEDHVLKKKKSVINMLRGKAMFYVTRLFKYKSVSATVKTPTAVMGVRGTKFGVEVREIGEKVADLSDKSFIYLAGLVTFQSDGTPTFHSVTQTIVYGFEGNVDVTGTADGVTQTVGAGETLVLDNTGAGNVEQTDPNTASQFLGETEIGTGGGGGGAGITGGGGTVEVSELLEEVIDTVETVSEDVAQTLTSQTIVTESVASGARVGYFAALLTRFDFYPPTSIYLADVYTNSTRSDFNSSSVTGNSIVNPAGFLSATDTGSDDTTYLSRINTVAGGPFDSGDLGTTREMDDNVNTAGWPMDDRLGQNSYMEWGFWAMSRWVSDGGSPYPKEFAVTDRAYYIDGLVTPDAAVAGMSGAYTYAGPAWGTYFDGGGGTSMIGIFACGIDMTAGTVTNFDMSVSGGGKSAIIGNASGSFVGSSGEFHITGGDWYLNNPSPMPIISGGAIVGSASASCTGSLFGPNSEHMGGAWAMDYGSGNNAAVGIFVGDKGGTPTPPATPPAIPAPPLP